jgi:cytochrome c oxidase subunit 4
MSQEVVSIKQYFVIFIILLVLLFVTVLMAVLIPASGAWRDVLTYVGFSIAAAKGVLIVLYFMHVKFSSRLTWLFASAAFAWLGIMLVITFDDYWTRAPRDEPPIRQPGRGAVEYRPEDSSGLRYTR